MERIKTIKKLRKLGVSYQQIGVVFSVERERIGQLVRQHLPKLNKVKIIKRTQDEVFKLLDKGPVEL